MEANKDELILNLQRNINKLKSLYEQVKQEKENLLHDKKGLEEKLAEAETKYNELDQKHSSLKVAKAVMTSSDEAGEAKQRINNLVREIDKCIALLNK